MCTMEKRVEKQTLSTVVISVDKSRSLFVGLFLILSENSNFTALSLYYYIKELPSPQGRLPFLKFHG